MAGRAGGEIEPQFVHEVQTTRERLLCTEPWGFPEVVPLSRDRRRDRAENHVVGVHARRSLHALPPEVLVEWSAPLDFQPRLDWIAEGVARRLAPQELQLFEVRRRNAPREEHARSRMTSQVFAAADAAASRDDGAENDAADDADAEAASDEETLGERFVAISGENERVFAFRNVISPARPHQYSTFSHGTWVLCDPTRVDAVARETEEDQAGEESDEYESRDSDTMSEGS